MATRGIIVKSAIGIEVKARRRLGDADAFDAVMEELKTAIEELKESQPDKDIADLDVSQNSLTTEQFGTLFETLAAGGMRVQRYRMFGCPTLNDEALQHLSDHFRNDLNSQSVPVELHLSDCAITAEGFSALVEAIEDNELYPVEEHGKKTPLYLRVENNYIDETVIQEKVDAGVVRKYTRHGPGGRRAADDSHKIDLAVKQTGGFQQKEGAPPDPEDAAPPKRVNDRNDSKGKTKGKDSTKGKGKVSPWDRDGHGKGKEFRGGKGKDFSKGGSKGGKGSALPPWATQGAARAALPAPVRSSFREAPRSAVQRYEPRTPLGSVRGSVSSSFGAPPPGRFASSMLAKKLASARDPRKPDSRREAPDSRREAPFARGSVGSKGAGKSGIKSSTKGSTKGEKKGKDSGRDPVRDLYRPGSAIKRSAADSDNNGDDSPKRQRFGVTGNKGDARAGGGCAKGGKKGASKSRPGKGGGSKLPPHWEEHFSEQYKLNYYWNKKTGDSSWEMPTN